MKAVRSVVNPVVVVIVLVVVLVGVALAFWKGAQGVHTGSGKMQSDLDFSKMEKDPNKLKQGIEESLRKDRERHGR